MNSNESKIQAFLKNKEGVWSNSTTASERCRLSVLTLYGFPDAAPKDVHAALSSRYKRYTVKQFFIRAAQIASKVFSDNRYQQFMEENAEAFRGVYVGRTTSLTDSDLEKFEKQLEHFNTGVWNAYILMRYAGLRKREALSIKWADVNLSQEFIVVKQGKGFKDRIVPFPRKHIQSLRSSISNYVCSRGVEAIVNIDRHFMTASVRAGVKVTPHALRAHALQTLSRVLTPHELKDYAGHSNFQTTLKYLVVDKEQVLSKIRGAL